MEEFKVAFVNSNIPPLYVSFENFSFWSSPIILSSALQHFTVCGGGGRLVSKSCLTLATPWTVGSQTPLPMGFSRQEYCSWLPFPSPFTVYIYGLLFSSGLKGTALHISRTFSMHLFLFSSTQLWKNMLSLAPLPTTRTHFYLSWTHWSMWALLCSLSLYYCLEIFPTESQCEHRQPYVLFYFFLWRINFL